MRQRKELIEILERQAVHINAARGLPNEEILAANVRALELLRRSGGRRCRRCGHYRQEIRTLQARFSRAMWRIGNLHLLVQDARECGPDDPYHRFEGLSLLRKIEQILDGEQEV